MPIYAYRCAACGFQKDALQKMSDAPLTQCPECGQETFSKQVTAAGFQLKGSGWYVTDFRGGNNAAAKPAGEAAAPAAPGATGTGTGETATAASASSSSAPAAATSSPASSTPSAGTASTASKSD